MSTNSISVASAGNNFLLLLDVLKVLHGTTEVHAAQGIDALTSVLTRFSSFSQNTNLEVHTEVRAPSLAGYIGVRKTTKPKINKHFAAFSGSAAYRTIFCKD